jgi:sulfur transfer complex TusBCD TusB component (DsrH family)
MANNQVVVPRSGPGTSEAEGALGLAQALLDQGGGLVLALLQDAVLLALKNGELPAQRRSRGLLERGARCVYLTEDLAMRGFVSDQALSGCSLVKYEELIDVLLADGASVAGAF